MGPADAPPRASAGRPAARRHGHLRRPVLPGAAATARGCGGTPPPPRKAVLVGRQDLAAGSFIQPESAAVAGMAGRCHRRLTCSGARRTSRSWSAPWSGARWRSGNPLSDGNLVKPGDRGFLAAVLDPGMRALSVPVDEASSNAGLIFPGDRVDLILTQTIDAEGDATARAGSARPCSRTCASSRWAAAERPRARRKATGQAGPHRDARGHAGGRREDRPGDGARQALPEPAQPGGRATPRAPPTGTRAHLGHRRQPGAAAGEPASLQPGRGPRRQARDHHHPPGSWS